MLHCCYFLVCNCRNYPQDCCFVFFSPLFSCRQNQKPALAFIFDPSLLQLTSTGVTADKLVVNDLTMEKLQHRYVLILEFAFSLCLLFWLVIHSFTDALVDLYYINVLKVEYNIELPCICATTSRIDSLVNNCLP